LLKIRLRRMGLRSRPTYRLVVIDSRKARDSEYLEAVGHYDPRTKALDLKPDRVEFWVARGARQSGTVTSLVRRYARQHAAAPAPAPEVAPVEPAAAAREAVELQPPMPQPEIPTATDAPKE